MAIETYRTIKLVATHANDTLLPVRLSADDHDGRDILMELWNGASAVTGSAADGLSAKLLYTTADGTGGYTNLTRTTSNGTVAFTGPFPTEMLGVSIGAMAVQVSDGTDVVATLRVPYVVDAPLIDEDSPEAQDALSEFRAAVAALDNLLPATTSRLGTVMVGDGLSATGEGVLSVDLSSSNLPTVPVDKGGTGQTTAKGGQYSLLNGMAEQTADATDDTYILAAHTSASASNGFAAKRKLSNVWTYIAGKIRSVFGFSSSNVLPVANGGTGATSGASALTNLGAVAKAGGTMTGTLYLDKVSAMVNTDYVDGTVVASGTEGPYVLWYDKSSPKKVIGRLGPWFRTNGTQGMRLLAQRNVSGSLFYNAVSLDVGTDGSPIVTFTGSDPATAWRRAINCIGCSDQTTIAASLNPLTTSTQQVALWFNVTNSANTDYIGKRCGLLILNNGVSLYNATGSASVWKLTADTETVTTVSSIATAASGVTITEAQYAVHNKVAQVRLAIQVSEAKSGVWSVATMVAGKRPAIVSYGETIGSGNYANMNTAGLIQYSGSLGTGNTLSLGFTYILA